MHQSRKKRIFPRSTMRSASSMIQLILDLIPRHTLRAQTNHHRSEVLFVDHQAQRQLPRVHRRKRAWTHVQAFWSQLRCRWARLCRGCGVLWAIVRWFVAAAEMMRGCSSDVETIQGVEEPGSLQMWSQSQSWDHRAAQPAPAVIVSCAVERRFQEFNRRPMHSRRWREAYEKSLPAGLTCSPTATTKSFHLANGASTDERAVVWRVPIFLQGFKGEVCSAEIASGTTPLLLSISAMTALDMVLFLRLREKMVEIRSLELTARMLTTQAKHLAIEVCFKEEFGVRDHHFLNHVCCRIEKTCWYTMGKSLATGDRPSTERA